MALFLALGQNECKKETFMDLFALRYVVRFLFTFFARLNCKTLPQEVIQGAARTSCRICCWISALPCVLAFTRLNKDLSLIFSRKF